MNSTTLIITLLASAALLFPASVQNASAITIDFDGFAADTLVTTPISGVTFTLADASAPSIFDGAASSAPNSLLNASSFDFVTPPADLTITFSTPVDDASFDYTFENGDVTFTVFQGATTTMVTDLFDSNPLDVETADFSAFSDVTALTMSFSFPDDFIAIDNLTFTRVPEPGSVVLGMLGVGGLLIRRRSDFAQKETGYHRLPVGYRCDEVTREKGEA